VFIHSEQLTEVVGCRWQCACGLDAGSLQLVGGALEQALHGAEHVVWASVRWILLGTIRPAQLRSPPGVWDYQWGARGQSFGEDEAEGLAG
jgi:hypothetical protein